MINYISMFFHNTEFKEIFFVLKTIFKVLFYFQLSNYDYRLNLINNKDVPYLYTRNVHRRNS